MSGVTKMMPEKFEINYYILLFEKQKKISVKCTYQVYLCLQSRNAFIHPKIKKKKIDKNETNKK